MISLLLFEDSFLDNFDNGTMLLFFAIFMVLAVVALLLMFRGAKRDKARIEQLKLSGDSTSKENFDKLLDGKFKTASKRSSFALFFVKLNGVEKQRQAFGNEQFATAMTSLMGRLEKELSVSAKVCRYYDDVILVLLDSAETENDLKANATIILMECRRPVQLAANLKLNFSVNVGVAQYNEFNKTVDTIKQNVQLALDAARRNGINTYAIFSSELSNQQSDAYRFYQEIKEAISNHDFTLYYQPIVDINTFKITGFESLLRWNHKTQGVLPPSKFLNILEQTGDINWVGLWAFEEMLKQYMIWKTRSPSNTLIVGMNLSPKQLMNDRLADEMRRIMKKYRVEPSNICLEIVEFAMYDSMDVIRGNIDKLRNSGFKIAIDNYGLETHTLSLIESLDIDIIKLDRDFISKASDNFITSSIITLLLDYAKRKNSMVVALGVENMTMLETSRKQGIGYAQGYLFSKPLAPNEINISQPLEPIESAAPIEAMPVIADNMQVSTGENAVATSSPVKSKLEKRKEQESIRRAAALARKQKEAEAAEAQAEPEKTEVEEVGENDSEVADSSAEIKTQDSAEEVEEKTEADDNAEVEEEKTEAQSEEEILPSAIPSEEESEKK